ncbi:MAG: universal stress protein [Rhizobiaceae bacterium]
MVSKRLIHEAGHKRKFLAVIDDSPECDRAVLYAARRAASTSGSLALLYVIPPGDFQHWIGVEEIMRAEANELGETTLDRFAQYSREHCDHDPEKVLKEGKTADEIIKLIEEDQDIALLVLAASDSSEGPGPLVSSIAGRGSAFPIPVTVVPCSMSNDDIYNVT